MKKTILLVTTLAILLAACAPSGPSKEEIATQVAQQVAVQLTALAPSPTPVPTDTPGITPVAIYTPLPPLPSPTATPEAPILGRRNNPIPLGTEAEGIGTGWSNEGYRFRIVVQQSVRGAPALTMIQEASPYNDPPKSGYDPLLIYIKVDFLSSPGDKAYEPTDYDFSLVTPGGQILEPGWNTPPEPAFSHLPSIFPGASSEGWIYFELPSPEGPPLLVFGLGYQGEGGLWFAIQ